MPILSIIPRFQADINRCTITAMKIALDYFSEHHKKTSLKFSENTIAKNAIYDSNAGTNLEASIYPLNTWLTPKGVEAKHHYGEAVTHEFLQNLIDHKIIPIITVDFKKWRPHIDEKAIKIQDEDFGFHSVAVCGYGKKDNIEKIKIFDPFYYFYKKTNSRNRNGVNIEIDKFYDVWDSNDSLWFEKCKPKKREKKTFKLAGSKSIGNTLLSHV